MKLPLFLASLLVLGASAFTTTKAPKAILPAKESSSKVSVYRDGYYGGGYGGYYDRYNRGGYGGYGSYGGYGPSLIESAVGSPNYHYGYDNYGYGGRYNGGYGYGSRYNNNYGYNNRYGYNGYNNRYGYGSGSYSPYYDDDSYYGRGYRGGLIGPSNYSPGGYGYGGRGGYYGDYDYGYGGGLSYNRIGSPYSRRLGAGSVGSRANGDYYRGYSNFDSPLYRNSYRSLATIN